MPRRLTRPEPRSTTPSTARRRHVAERPAAAPAPRDDFAQGRAARGAELLPALATTPGLFPLLAAVRLRDDAHWQELSPTPPRSPPSSVLTAAITLVRAQLGELRNQVAALDAELASKKKSLAELTTQKSALIAQIAEAEQRDAQLAVLGAFLGGLEGFTVARVVSTFQGQLAGIEKQVAANEAEVRVTEEFIRSYESSRAALDLALRDLCAEETKLTQGHGAGGQTLAVLGALHDNLVAQRGVLLKMRDDGHAFGAALEQFLTSLSAQIDALSAQKQAAEEGVIRSTLELLVQAGALPATVDAGRLTLAGVTALLDARQSVRDAFARKLGERLSDLPPPLRDELVKTVMARLTR